MAMRRFPKQLLLVSIVSAAVAGLAGGIFGGAVYWAEHPELAPGDKHLGLDPEYNSTDVASATETCTERYPEVHTVFLRPGPPIRHPRLTAREMTRNAELAKALELFGKVKEARELLREAEERFGNIEIRELQHPTILGTTAPDGARPARVAVAIYKGVGADMEEVLKATPQEFFSCVSNEYSAMTKEKALAGLRTERKRRVGTLLLSATYIGFGAGAVSAVSLGLLILYWVVIGFVAGVRDAMREDRED